jgi:hypothetical protein
MKETITITCGWDGTKTDFKYPVRLKDSSVIGLYSCPDCGCWYEIEMKEVSEGEGN